MQQEKKAQSPFKSLLMTSLGGCFEFFDFIIFVLFAVYFSKVIFPTESENSIIPLLQSYAVFAVGYVARPFGGIVIAHLGDTLGRRKAMITSICIMTGCTLIMGLIPTYAQIGLWSPVIFSLLRVLQGIAIGGELPGCITYICETLPRIRGLSCSILFAMVGHGVSLGTMTNWILISHLSMEEMYHFGWRIPFIMGTFIGLLTLFIRLSAEESPGFCKQKKQCEAGDAHCAKSPVLTVLKYFPLQAIGGALITGYMAAITSLFFLVMNAYLLSLGYQDKPVAEAITINMFVAANMMVFWGYFSDKVKARRLLAVSVCIFCIALPVIYYRIINHHDNLLTNLLILGAFSSVNFGVVPKTLAEIFPANARCSGIAFSYNTGFATLGGLSPLIVTYFMDTLQTPFIPVYFLWGAALLGIFGLLMIYAGNKQVGIHDHIADGLEQKTDGWRH